MRPVDQVHEPLPDNGLWYSSRGWRGWILPLLFPALIVASAIISVTGVAPWWTWWVQGTGILVVMLTANVLLRKLLPRRS